MILGNRLIPILDPEIHYLRLRCQKYSSLGEK